MAKRKNPKAVELADAAAASQAMAMQYRRALRELVDACGHVNLGAMNGTTVKDFRKVMAFMAACDAAKELVGDE
jgi:hypothetical protein